MMTRKIVELEGLGCQIGYKHLLKDITWTICEGDRWIVFGMNGSGKTTLLSIIAGFCQLTEGSMRVFGEKIDNENILSMRKKIGWISASFFDKFYSRESAMDIVLSGKYGTLGVQDGITLQERREAKEFLKELGLERYADHSFDMLSKGERQNVLIARALFSHPRILILDEPCTGLDIYNREYLFQSLEKMSHKKDLTIIYVTHYLEEIKPYFDKCLLLRNGRIFSSGRVETLFQDDVMEKFLDCKVAIKKDAEGIMGIEVKNVTAKLVDLLRKEDE